MKKNIPCKVALTIENDRHDLLKDIEIINKLKVVDICNLGVISKKEVCELYSVSKSLIFPSLEETFGLPLVEAALMGLDVIAPNLKYVFQVIKPSVTYSSKSPSSCALAMEEYLSDSSIKKSTSIVNNQVNKLIQNYTTKKNV